MKHYRDVADAALAAVLMYSALACCCIMLANVGYHLLVTQINFGRKLPNMAVWHLTGLPFVPLLVMAIVANQHLRHGKIPWRCYAGLLVGSAVAFVWAFAWFSGPMHDIALLFGSHARWGCDFIGPTGTAVPNPYIIRNTTVPWMLFAPALLASVAHWRWAGKAQ